MGGVTYHRIDRHRSEHNITLAAQINNRAQSLFNDTDHTSGAYLDSGCSCSVFINNDLFVEY